VTVYFDPFDLRSVTLKDREGKTSDAFPVDLSGNRRVRRNPEKDPPSSPAPRLRALEDLARKLDEKETENPKECTDKLEDNHDNR